MSRWLSGYRLASILLVLANFLLGLALYHWLPDPYPTRMDSNGLIVGFTRKPIGPFVTPLITAAALLGMFVLPKLSPKGFRVDKFIRVFDMIYFVSIAASVMVSILGMLQRSTLLSRPVYVGSQSACRCSFLATSSARRPRTSGLAFAVLGHWRATKSG